jgi:hypothetical protein
MKSSDNLPHYVKRRAKANARERCRMLNLNKSLDRLRKHVPLCLNDYSGECRQNDVKLPKIETLKMATNYIKTLNYSLEQNRKLQMDEFIYLLSFNLRPTTISLIKSKLCLESEVENQLLVDGMMQIGRQDWNNGLSTTNHDEESDHSSVCCKY